MNFLVVGEEASFLVRAILAALDSFLESAEIALAKSSMAMAGFLPSAS
jgi:hypothetical protein